MYWRPRKRRAAALPLVGASQIPITELRIFQTQVVMEEARRVRPLGIRALSKAWTETDDVSEPDIHHARLLIHFGFPCGAEGPGRWLTSWPARSGQQMPTTSPLPALIQELSDLCAVPVFSRLLYQVSTYHDAPGSSPGPATPPEVSVSGPGRQVPLHAACFHAAASGQH